MMFYDSHHLQHKRERLDMEQKYMDSDKTQRKEPELTTLISEMGDDTNIYSKQVYVLQYKL